MHNEEAFCVGISRSPWEIALSQKESKAIASVASIGREAARSDEGFRPKIRREL
jgi:hypothetical protein